MAAVPLLTADNLPPLPLAAAAPQARVEVYEPSVLSRASALTEHASGALSRRVHVVSP